MQMKDEQYDSTAIDFVNDITLVRALRFISEQAWALEVFGNEEKDAKLEKMVDKALNVVEKRVAYVLKGTDGSIYHKSRKEIHI